MQESVACEEARPGVSALSDVNAGDANQLSQKPTELKRSLKVVVGIPLMGGTPAASYHDRLLMFKYLGHREEQDYQEKKFPHYCFTLNVTGDILVQYARERFAQAVLEMDADYLLMIDDDMLAPPDLFYRLAANDKDICAALPFSRNPDHKPVIYDVIAGFDHATTKDYR